MANTSLLQFNSNKCITYSLPISVILSTAQLHKHQRVTAVTTQDSKLIHAPGKKKYYSLFLFSPMCLSAGCTYQPFDSCLQILAV